MPSGRGRTRPLMAMTYSLRRMWVVAMRFRRDFRAEHHLREAVAIAQVHEDEAAVVAAILHPAHEAHGLTVVGNGQVVAVMGALPVTQRFDVSGVFLLNIHDVFFRCLQTGS